MSGWVNAALLGALTAFAVCYNASEDRLQGYAQNEEDVVYWTAQAEYERRVQAGQVDPFTEGSASAQMLKRMFGVRKVDVSALEKDYYGVDAGANKTDEEKKKEEE
jgi:hypothetical protein